MRYSKVSELEVDEVIKVDDSFYQIEAVLEGSHQRAFRVRSLISGKVRFFERHMKQGPEVLVLDPDEASAIVVQETKESIIRSYEGEIPIMKVGAFEETDTRTPEEKPETKGKYSFTDLES